MKEFESKYKEAKEFINGVYGMFVTKIINDTITFEDGEWGKEEITTAKADEKLAEMAKTTQYYSYSTRVWTAAYARKHLWDLIDKVGNDVVYCDTDSVKFIGKHNLKHFKEDNITVDRQIDLICDATDLEPHFYKIDKPKGGKAELGYFEEDGAYAQFKTLGAKKYAYITKENYNRKSCKGCIHTDSCPKYIEYEECSKVKCSNCSDKCDVYNKCKRVHITVAGVNKEAGAKYFKNLKMFSPLTMLDYKFSGKKMVKYNREQVAVTFPDGYTATEKVGCVLTPTTYLLNVTKDYSSLMDIYETMMGDDYDDYDENESIVSTGAKILG